MKHCSSEWRASIDKVLRRTALSNHTLHGLSMMHRANPYRSWAKRAFDVILSSLGLLFSAPLWPLIALAIKLEDGGPVFYVHERWGRGRRVIRVWKFRSMVADAGLTFGAVPAAVADPRVTKTGLLLRRMGLDELPQL